MRFAHEWTVIGKRNLTVSHRFNIAHAVVVDVDVIVVAIVVVAVDVTVNEIK